MDYFRCDGIATVNIDNSIACDNWAIISETELLTATPIQQLYELLNAAFETPNNTSIVVAFMAAFTLPLVCYLTAWAFKTVVKFIN
jgi:hypothetical protein